MRSSFVIALRVLLISVSGLCVPSALYAAGPMVIVNIEEDSIEIREGDDRTTIAYDAAARDVQAMRIPYNDAYYVLGLRWQGDALRLFAYDTFGIELASRRVFHAGGARDFSVMRMDTVTRNDERLIRVRAIYMNAAERPVKLQTARFRITPDAGKKQVIKRVKYSVKKIAPPNLAGLSDPEAGAALYNYQRVSSGLLPVPRSSALDSACALHSEYMRVHDELTHEEEVGQTGYSEDGARAGDASNITRHQSGSMTQSVHNLFSAVYHRFSMMDNYLLSFGYALSSASATQFRYATFDVYSNAVTNNRYGEEDYVTYYDPAVHALLPYPAEGQTGVPTTFDISEYPDPLEPFDASYPAGYAISLGFSAVSDPTEISMELFDPKGASISGYFRAPNDPDDPFILYQGGNATFIPKLPLASRTTYRVHAAGKINGEAFAKEWEFTTE